MASPVDVADPGWFLFDYRPEHDRFAFARVPLERLTRSAFLDQRLALDEAPVALDAGSVLADLPTPLASPALLFHTAFCGSTLLARALDAPPDAVSLKEPLALHSLGRAALRTGWSEPLPARLRAALTLLARPWTPDGRVLLKPANQANGLLPHILAAAPDARAILLYSDLREFIVSCLKKGPEAETRVRWMAQALLPFTTLPARLGLDVRTPFNLVESCALAWYAQIELYADALANDRSDRLRSLDLDTMLAAPADVVDACAAWLGLSGQDVAARAARVFGRNSKTDAPYDPLKRAAERDEVLREYGPLVDSAVGWAQATVGAVAVQPADWKPLLPTR
ncbi:MAG TPA: hypothetical protein VEY50_02805 [Lysobacter sp.]|nr:hypothetical protein [Lysobacter sp.]